MSLRAVERRRASPADRDCPDFGGEAAEDGTVPLFPDATWPDSDDFRDSPPDAFDDRDASDDWTHVDIDAFEATF